MGVTDSRSVDNDIIRIIETSYQVDQDEHAWMSGILAASRSSLDHGLGLVATLYDVSDVEHPSASVVNRLDVPDAYNETTIRDAFASLSTDCVRSLVTSTGCHLVRWDDRFCDSPTDSPTRLTSLPFVPSPFEPTDVVVINAADPTGHGCFISANVRRGSSVSRAKRALWARLAAHVCAGLRLRRRLDAQTNRAASVEAVLSVDGRIEHAEEPAKSALAREALTRAARSQERARGKLRRTAPDEAVDEWKGLIAARWTLIEQFDHDGRRYLVAERNDALEDVRWIDSLTPREHQVVAYASLGHWSKLIAYELGIADATVRVLLTRAVKKAGVHSRAELVERFLRDRLKSSM